MFKTPSLGSLASVLSVTALMALGSGCYAEADAEPAYVDATAAPVDVDTAPNYYYEGRTVYYVNDHWYARDRDRWVYYRTEPEPLARHRVEVQRAPRAPERVQVRTSERVEERRAPQREVHTQSGPERPRQIERPRREESPRAEHSREAPRAERIE